MFMLDNDVTSPRKKNKQVLYHGKKKKKKKKKFCNDMGGARRK